jgi:glycosyltransferase involved in cell wall biosynthesis
MKRWPSLNRAISSVILQEGVVVDVIVIVNGTRFDHNCYEELKARPELTVVYQEEGSLPLALRLGRSLVTAPAFAFLDDDDEYLPGTLRNRVQPLLVDKTIDYVVSNGYRCIGGQDRPHLTDLSSIRRDALEALSTQNWLASCGGLFRSSSVHIDYFDGKTAYFEWTFLAYKLASTLKMAFVEAHTFRIHDSPASLSKSDVYKETEIQVLAKILVLDLPSVVKQSVRAKAGWAYHSLSGHYLQKGRVGLAWRHHLTSLLFPGGWHYVAYTRKLLPFWPVDQKGHSERTPIGPQNLERTEKAVPQGESAEAGTTPLPSPQHPIPDRFPIDLPLVSVIMPAFNSELFIREAIDSALGQDYPNIEIIVIDDGSTDSTSEIIKGYGDKVRFLSQENQGSAAARNLGIQNARGIYVAFLDADDIWWPKKISYQVQALLETGFKMAYSRFFWWYADSSGNFRSVDTFSANESLHLSSAEIVTGWTYTNLLLDCIVWTSTVIVEKAEIEKVGFFNQNLRKGQDYDLWLRLSRNIKMLGLEPPTALYRIHSDSITSSVKDVNYEYLILSSAVNKWGESGPDLKLPPPGLVQQRLARSMFGHGYSHYKKGNVQIAAASFLQSMRHSGVLPKPALLFLLSKLKCLIAGHTSGGRVTRGY